MSGENYFDKHVEEHENRIRAAEQARANKQRERDNEAYLAEQQAQAEAKRLKLATVEQAAKPGAPPADVWGEDAGKVCEEFLDFARSKATRSGVLPGAIIAPRKPRTGRYESFLFTAAESGFLNNFASRSVPRGYPIAYTFQHPTGNCQPSGLENHEGPPYFNSPGFESRKKRINLEPDVMLCTDGLLRYGRGNIPVDASGEVVNPKVGKLYWAVYKSESTDYSGELPETRDTYSESLGFEEVDLREKLGEIAIRISQA